MEHSGPLTEMVLYGCVAVRAGKVIDMSPTGDVLTDVPKEWIHPVYREGWSM